MSAWWTGRRRFWDAAYLPFMEREINRAQLKLLVQKGLEESGGSYTKLAVLFNVSTDQYQKFMDFLRHHNLKVDR